MNRLNIIGIAVLALFCGGCSGTEAEARSYLESQGIGVTELKKDGAAFQYTGKKGDEICSGTVTIKKGLGTSQQNHTNYCVRDTSACKPGAAAACVKLADEFYGREAKVFPEQAAEFYRMACADGDGHACARAGEFEGIGKNWSGVRDYSQKGCELGNGDACARLGLTELEGLGTDKNPTTALKLMKKACEKASMRGCRNAAGVLLDQEASDPEGAVPFATKACTAKFEDACFVLGLALFRAKKEYSTAFIHLEASCNDEAFKKRGVACNIAGVMATEGLGMKKDAARGLPLFEKACANDYPDGCSNSGKLYKKGLGVDQDKTKSDEFFAKACKLGLDEYCKK